MITKAFIERIRREATVDTDKYRYTIKVCDGYAEIIRIPIGEKDNPQKWRFVCRTESWPTKEEAEKYFIPVPEP